MLNMCCFEGRIANDPRIVENAISGKKGFFFTLAVPRNYKDEDGNRGADFLPMVAYRGAETYEKHLAKGDMVSVTALAASYMKEGAGKDGTAAEKVIFKVDSLHYITVKYFGEKHDDAQGVLDPAEDEVLPDEFKDSEKEKSANTEDE